MDKEGSDIQARKESSKEARKSIAKSTKEFRRIEACSKVQQEALGPLIKKYQSEIDNLTKRAQQAERAFFDIYASLQEALDPVSALEASLSQNNQIEALERRCREFQSEINSYSKEFEGMTNQRKLIRDLEKKLNDAESAVDKRVDEEVSARLQDVEGEHSSTEARLRNRVMEADNNLRASQKEQDALQAKLDHLQEELFDSRRNHSEIKTGLQHEVDELGSRMQVLKIQNAQLKREVRKVKAGASSEHINRIDDSHAEVLRVKSLMKDLESQLLDRDAELHQMKRHMDSSKNELEEALQKSNTEIQRLSTENSRLIAETTERPTVDAYNALRRKLEVLQRLESNLTPSNSPPSDSLDAIELGSETEILLAEHRNMSEELTSSQEELKLYKNQVEKFREEIVEIKKECEAKDELIEDLQDEFTSKESSRHSMEKTYTDRNAQILSGVLTQHSDEDIVDDRVADLDAKGISDDSDDVKLMEIVQAQRDRFRKRMLALQANKDASAQQITQLQNSIKHLEADNAALYEKIRYLENYKGRSMPKKGNSSVSNQLTISNDTSSNQMEIGKSTRNVEARYKSAYEAKMNPFATFESHESEERIRKLNVVDRTLLVGGKIVLSNTHLRKAAFFYILFLHMLVAMTLWSFLFAFAVDNDNALPEEDENHIIVD